MKVLQVNNSDIAGGAARAAYRLHIGLRKFGIDSSMLTNFKYSDDSSVIAPLTPLEKLKSQLSYSLEYRHLFLKPKSLFSSALHSFTNTVEKINKLNPDIVHLHWVNGGMLRIEDINKIKAPIVWSMHDNWLFTGGCHVMYDCKGYLKKCGNCRVLGSSSENDRSSKTLSRKIKVFANNQQILPIALSGWMLERAQESFLLSGRKIANIPNPINVDVYNPFDKSMARKLWNLPQQKKLVLFGAMSATSDENKGYKYLIAAVKQLKETSDIEFIVFGSSKPECDELNDFKTHYVGKLSDDVALKSLYSACDVMVVPSKQENLSNAIMESLACGTPVVAFNVGGNGDLIDHLLNGYLAQPFNTKDLAQGIEWMLNHLNYDEVSRNAVIKVKERFSEEVIIPMYIKLYNDILKGKK